MVGGRKLQQCHILLATSVVFWWIHSRTSHSQKATINVYTIPIEHHSILCIFELVYIDRKRFLRKFARLLKQMCHDPTLILRQFGPDRCLICIIVS